MTQGFCGFLVLLFGVGAMVKVLVVWLMVMLGSDDSFLSANQNKNI